MWFAAESVPSIRALYPGASIRPELRLPPELASREHLEKVEPIVDEAVKRAGCSLADIDAIAVTAVAARP